MTVVKKPKSIAAQEKKYIAGGADVAEKKERGREPRKAGKTPITITIDPKLLARIDEAADKQGLSRAAFISQGMFYVVDRGIFKA